MEPLKIHVGGTSKLFVDEKSIELAIPEFAGNFPSDQFEFTNIENADFLILFNYKSGDYSRFIKSGGKRENTVLVRMEPYAVYPAQYKEKVTCKFGLIITAGHSEIDNKKFLNVNWPYKYHLNPATPATSDPNLKDILERQTSKNQRIYESWNSRESKISMIAANKVSPTSNSNYKLRRQLAKQLSSESLNVYGPLWNSSIWLKARHRIAVLYASMRQATFPNLFEIYGNFWRTYPNALGEIRDKHEVLTKSKFALVIENSNDVITEKLFDALINGALPLYVGPDLSKAGLPENLAIQIKQSDTTIQQVTDEISRDLAEKILSTGREFILSETFRTNFSSEFVFKDMSIKIKKYINTNWNKIKEL
jgi:hypothetical protein